MRKCFACKIKYRNQSLFQTNDDKVTTNNSLFKKRKEKKEFFIRVSDIRKFILPG